MDDNRSGPRPLKEFPDDGRQAIRGVFTDIDDTLTTHGRLTAGAYRSLERLHDAGLLVVPVTGRPAGWCDHIARFWPVDGVIGENGAFYMRHDRESSRMLRVTTADLDPAFDHRDALDRLGERIVRAVPGSALASDQAFRSHDLAIDYCEDVPPLAREDVAKILRLFEAAGATAKVSSIHVNGWFGHHDKLTAVRRYMTDCHGINLDLERDRYIFIGDSPNDAPLFGYFPNAIAVANVLTFIDDLAHCPRYVTAACSGDGFSEMANWLLGVD